MGAVGSNEGLGVYRREVEGVEGHEHVQEAGQLVSDGGACGEPGARETASTKMILCVRSGMFELCELCFVSKELLLEVKRMTRTRIA